MRVMSRFAFSLFTLLSVAFAGERESLANGRFPRAQRLIESPTDANRLTIAATYGLLTTSDRGKTWYHVCETAFSFNDMYTGDPLLGLTNDESLLLSAESTISVSHDRGCQWTSTFGSAEQSVIDFSQASSNRNDVVAVVATYQNNTTVNRLQESTDGGATWKAIGAALPVRQVYTVDLDPKDPTHIYATGLDASEMGVFLTSVDRGGNWTSKPIPNTNTDDVPYIAAVHPGDSKKIFVRTDAWTNRDVVDTGNDALLYTEDGGATWKEVLRHGAKLFGFALSPDGKTVVAGYGDPGVAAQAIDPTVTGVYRAPLAALSAQDAPFERVYSGSVTCLTWTQNGVYMCTGGVDSQFDLALVTNDDFVSCVTPLLKLADVAGVPPNCAGRAVSTCDWKVDCAAIGACDGGAPPEQPLMNASCSVPDAGAGLVDAPSGSAGSTTSSGAGGTTSSGQGGSALSTDDTRSGCGCRVTRAGGSASALLSLVVFGVATSWRLVFGRGRRRRVRSIWERPSL
ncbi:MAG TPA: hypothetical protein VJT73_15900 [Polyangiaceae bacterium]|nr:hypothetical protein [Polyangiaceae bacterium]